MMKGGALPKKEGKMRIRAFPVSIVFVIIIIMIIIIIIIIIKLQLSS